MVAGLPRTLASLPATHGLWHLSVWAAAVLVLSVNATAGVAEAGGKRCGDSGGRRKAGGERRGDGRGR